MYRLQSVLILLHTGSKSSEVISQLLEAGVDVNRRNVLGMNALLLVAGYADERLVKLVLDAGADPTSANDFGHTALHLAIVGKRSQLKVLTALCRLNPFTADPVNKALHFVILV